MGFPDKPTVHEGQPFSSLRPTEWRIWSSEEYSRIDPFRTCNYCGSIHPEDLLKHSAESNIRIHSADWKYGWPHKFYVDGIPNPQAGEIVKIGSKSYSDESGKRIEEPIMGSASPDTPAKFYSEHLKELEEEEFNKVAELIFLHTRIKFEIREEKLYYRRF